MDEASDSSDSRPATVTAIQSAAQSSRHSVQSPAHSLVASRLHHAIPGHPCSPLTDDCIFLSDLLQQVVSFEQRLKKWILRELIVFGLHPLELEQRLQQAGTRRMETAAATSEYARQQ